MKCVVIYGIAEYAKKQLHDLLVKKEYQVLVLKYPGNIPGYQLYQTIVDYDPDWVFTVDLAGFSLKTETDEIAYINLTCPNVHFLSREIKPEECECLAGKLSIAMFYYCLDRKIYDFLKANCPEIPYLKMITDWEDGVEDAFKEIG